MGWTVVWLGQARGRLHQLKLDKQTALTGAVERFAQAVPSAHQHPGRLRLLDGWWADVNFQRNARYTDDDGEEASGNVLCVLRLFIPPPNSLRDEWLGLLDEE